MEQILGNSCTLSLPVEPHTSCAVVYMISSEYHINCGMHLDTADLSTGEILLVVYVMDMIVLDDGENSAHMTYDTGLTALVYMTASDNVRTYCFLGPAFIYCLHYTVSLSLCTVLKSETCPLVFILRLQILSKADTGASGITDFAILYDPTL